MLKKIFKALFIALSFFVAAFGIFLAYSMQPGVSSEEFPVSEIKNFSIQNPVASGSDKLTVISYNMGYGSGIRNNKIPIADRAELMKNLDEMVARLGESKADLIFLQEVDFRAHRTFDVDEMRYLAEKLGMPYGAYTLTWNKKYVAWPYWPPSSHFGRVVSGQAVLSRYPILTQQLLEFPKPSENAFWYNWFYLDRIVQHLTLQVGDKAMSVYNVHLEAFAEESREEQLHTLQRMVKADPASYKMVAGDFNLASQMAADAKDDDKSRDRKGLLGDFSKTTGLQDAITDPKIYSMPSWKPDKLIDHIFYSAKFHLLKSGNLSDSQASDHLAIWANLGF